jgi:hypothetical protein
MDPPSIKNKRLRKEIPLLPYEVQWKDGDDHLFIPQYNMTITVTDWYPFQYPTMKIDGIDEKMYAEQIGRAPTRRRITKEWCPSYGIREFVDDFLHL